MPGQRFGSRLRAPDPGRAPAPSGLEPPRRKRGAPALGNLTAQSQRSLGELEREAEDLSRRASRGERVRRDAPGRPAPSTLPTGGGHSPGPEACRIAEEGFGLDPGAVRIHDNAEDRLLASSAGAQAMADGAHIWLGQGASESDRELMAHELAHVAQGEPGLYLRSATWIERRAWLSFFDHYLPRKFLNNYMDDSGAAITLTLLEMVDVNPIVNIRQSKAFASELSALAATAKGYAAAGKPAPAAKYLEISGPGQALTNGTLGNFTIHYKGTLMVNPDGSWIFAGTIDFYDIWDFDPKPFGTSGRSTAGEVKTRVASAFLPGSPFDIHSVPAPFSQSSTQGSGAWVGGAPHPVLDKSGRTGGDVAVGGVGGDVAAGPVGGDVGGEVGAQSAEDLN
jgi:hypothetical protein